MPRSRRPRAKSKTPKKRAPRAGRARRARQAFHAPVSDAHIAWVDSVIASVAKAGGLRLTREQVLFALIDAAAGRPIDARKVRTLEDLRVAFGALDLSAVESMLRDRPRIEGGLLKALEDSIK